MNRIMAASVIFAIALWPMQVTAGDRSLLPTAAGMTIASDVNLDKTVADAVEFRAEFGFASDPTAVTRLLTDPTSDYSFGAPLSPDELANMEHRLALREAAERVVGYVASQPGAFGGLYFTQNTGDLILYVLPVEKVSPDILHKALAMVPEGLVTKVRSVGYSMNELLAAEDRLSSRRDDLHINEIGLDVIGNGLELVFEPGAKTASALDLANVPTTVSNGPGPQAATCTNPSSCTPYRGGIGIFSPQSNQFCTWGFYGTRGTAAKYIITAGHCAAVGDTESHLGTVFSDPVDQDTFQMVSSDKLSDSMTAHVKGSANAVSPFNTIYVSGSDKAHTITAQRSTGSQAVGDAVCFEGAHTGTALCGVIEATGLSYILTRFDGRSLTLHGQIRMSRVTVTGDSGGPVYQSHTAYGIVNALNSGNSHMLYSTIVNVEADMGNTIICLTAAC